MRTLPHPNPLNRPRVCLALSGGGARGLAHIGVLKVLEEAHIPIDALTGTSMGGIIAAAYAAGFTPVRMEEIALRLATRRELLRLVDLSASRRGLLEGAKVHRYLRDLLGEQLTFEGINLPLALTAVDLNSGREVMLAEGELLPAVFATMSVPGLFPPQVLHERRLVDGGVLDNIPTCPARQMGAEVVIAVDVQINPRLDPAWDDIPPSLTYPLPWVEMLMHFYRAELVMIAELTESRLREYPPDLLLRPRIAPNITMLLGFPFAAEIIAAGEAAAREHLEEIRLRLGG